MGSRFMLYYGNWVMANLNLDQFSLPRSHHLLYQVWVLQKYTMCVNFAIVHHKKQNSYMKTQLSTIKKKSFSFCMKVLNLKPE